MKHLHALKQSSALGMGRWSQTSLYHMRIPVDASDPCSTDKAVILRYFLSPVPVVPSPKDHECINNNDPNCTNLCKIANQFKPVKWGRASANSQDED